MGEKSMKKDIKKKKKSDIKSISMAATKTLVAQPELITKKKKPL